MRMVTPANGVIVDVAERLVERYKARGYKEARREPAPSEEARTEEGQRPKPRPRRKA